MIRMFNGKVVGHGNSVAEAAIHLAAQLRKIARLVEAHKGIFPVISTKVRR